MSGAGKKIVISSILRKERVVYREKLCRIFPAFESNRRRRAICTVDRRRSKEKHHPVGWCFSLVRFRSAVQIVRLRRIYSKAGKPDKGFPCKHPFPCGKWKILHLFCQRFTDKETEDPQWFPGFPFIFNSLRAYQNCKDIAGISTKETE